ncbi:MAG: hypothetical protein DIZ80_00525 [endosymbiont of Galathealinum brachiosum]|uniref:Uncharacterized protein n=1 Tax=endosymbiont of Galathealinum brachiosum TaxID=2200906 RepID=A0A370DM56_9GAMM|nr:MAG: hypothetical protein DIZ80_00525 [endosymbiont of Galathealinum brachiosum]
MNFIKDNLVIKRIQQLIICSIIFPVSGIALSAAPDNRDDLVYLSIIATETEEIRAINKHTALSKQFKNLKVISSNDCTNLKPGLVLYVSQLSNDNSAAKKALKETKTRVPDAYLRKCDIKENSLLSKHYSFIHSSIFNLPDDVINWSFDDMKSELVSLNDNSSFLIEKQFNGDINNEVEGRQSVIYFINKNSTNKQLILKQCWDFKATDQNKQLITFQCMTGMAANHYIHTVYVYNINKNNILYKKEYCQQANFKDDSQLSCLEESVDEMGELKRVPVDLSLTKLGN